MTDHRVTDLSHGQLGEATYDPEEQRWKFSQKFTDVPSIIQLLPLEEWLEPSAQVGRKENGKASTLTRNKMRWLAKKLPESVPASPLISKLVRASCQTLLQSPAEAGSLLAIGRAHDVDRVSGVRRPRIMAVPYGGAGHILRLIKPRVKTQGWGKASGARLSLLNLESFDTGYWVGTGGTIRQIVFADAADEREIWLAIRQEGVTTVFRPRYGRVQKPAVPVNEDPTLFAPSMLDANPIASLTTQRTGSIHHADVAFNPWFPRQVAIVDTQGYWSVWDLEVQRGKDGAESFVPRKTGGIYVDQDQDYSSKSPLVASLVDHADGWYRIMWVCNLNTIIVCNRRHLVVFDVKGATTFIGRAIIFPKGNTDWILDIKRSTSDSNHLFVLTTTRLFWLEIVPTENQSKDKNNAVKIILSYIHFMSPEDEGMKLALFNSDHVSVAIASAKIPVLQYFSFRKDRSGARASSKGTLSLSSFSSDEEGRSFKFHTVQFLPCTMIPSASHTSGPGPKYMEDGVEFFQLWALTSDLGLVSTLSAVTEGSKQLDIVPPERKLLISQRYRGPRIANDDDFIVPDDEIDIITPERNSAFNQELSPVDDQVRLTLDWRWIFQNVFLKKITPPGCDSKLADLLSFAVGRIKQGMENNDLQNSTLSEITGMPMPGDDLQQASPALRDFLKSLELEQSPEANQILTIKDLTQGSNIRFPEDPDSKYPDLINVFDQLVDYWMSSLPANLHNVARHAKFKAIGQLAMELSLSAIGISIQDRALSVPDAVTQLDEDTATLPGVSKDNASFRDSSPVLFSSQLATMQDGLGLPTPTATPSLHSQATSVSGLVEDPVIARLRRYAPTIKAKTDWTENTNASVLSHWSTELGADPAKYSYETAKQKHAAANSGDDVRRSSKKEKARRRRRTEEFVKAVEPAVSRRSNFFSGSQPEAADNPFSSQVLDDMPMTQPVGGAYGSRTMPQRKKKAKKSRTAGFK
ncbi:uncharacterized protein L3040_007000 [Drepanopeziza brunnea f. sp. 'multigermtubi']|uniref:RNA polymerase I-specific transcription initiation factor RRN6-like protein n=1 Tax=Marssonina brunnea f. sp. multigermtubi (strain MB_m1) TaxID=1072389 RepID=K1WJ02_MARBU|nr:uncharacterized protein MBM_09075 [Drepanopeziza brunnea f. sp. 'multigermtubi' MB_m1]EKD12846.1 hypothetical protein MBM_09075 [Drepanopeziza brunnea f. sp. 'multigermtubi' MB_m1]KAJ5038131.1 hypothetical protein L3040_007000 [Drepanopeziza brunnea f. sp. 'multigermtubi']